MLKIEVGPHVVDFVIDRVCGGISLGHGTGIGTSRDGVLVGGCVYYTWNHRNVFMHSAADDSRWLNRTYLHYLFDYAFNVCNVERITGLVDEDNIHAQQFNNRIGFELETRMKNACPSGDILVYVMYKDDCKWISEARHATQ